MDRILIVFSLFLFTLSQTHAADQALEAFRMVEQKNYEGAAKIYESLIQVHGATSDLCFNLGTCYLYLQRTPEARVYLERALSYQPGSEKIKNQLRYINQRIEPKIEALPAFFLYGGLVRLRDIASSQIWGLVMLTLAFVCGALGIKNNTNKSTHVLKYIKIAGFLFVITSLIYLSRKQFEYQVSAILMTNSPLKIAPEVNSQELIPLGAGTKMQVIDSLDGWWKVQLENNDQGWLPKESLVKI